LNKLVPTGSIASVSGSDSFNFHSISQPGHADAITIPDAHLLFAGDYNRLGNDLIVSDHLHRFVLPNYFSGGNRPTLLSPEGAALDPRYIEALTGHTEYAQAGAPVPGGKVIGHVVKMTGSASIVRNGVAIVVNVGDNVNQSDVVQTGSNSTLGLVLDDGTTCNLLQNARLLLNELNYEQNGTSNHSLLTLIQGGLSFVAGQIAPTGDMRVATPVSTIGIRGTAVVLDVSSTDGTVSVSVVDQHDNQVHAVQVYNTQGTLIATVTSNGSSLTLTPVSPTNVVAQESNKTTDQINQEFNVFQQVLNTYDAGKQMFPNLAPHTENNTNPNDTSPSQHASLGSSSQPTNEPAPTLFVVDTANSANGGGDVTSSGVGTVGAGSVTSTGNLTQSQSSTANQVALIPVTPLATVEITNTTGGPVDRQPKLFLERLAPSLPAPP
jgi:hypothetical protein